MIAITLFPVGRHGTALALVLGIAFLCAVGAREYVKGGVLSGDTLQVLDGTAATDACLHAGQLRCRRGVGWWPPIQYIPALALKRLGTSRTAAGNALIYLNGLAVLATLLLLWIVGRRSRAPGIAPLLVVAGLVSPLLWYGDSGFAEALAGAATTALVVSIVLGWNPVIAVLACWVAVISKETALPFVLAFGAIAIVVRLRLDRSARSYALALAAGAAAGIATIAALNLFRYGVPWNRYYLRTGWEVQSLSRRAEFFAAELVAPNAGLIWFWPVASMVIAVWGFHSIGVLRTRRQLRSKAGASVAALIAFVLLLATFASWWSPFGWFALGSRLIVPWVPPLLALAAAAAAGPIYAAFTRLVRARLLLAATCGVVFVLGLAELGAMLQPLRPLSLFDQPSCAYVPGLLERIPAGDPAAHAAEDECVSRRAWTDRPVLADSLHALRGSNVLFGLLYCAALIGLIAAASMEANKRPEAEIGGSPRSGLPLSA